MNVWDIVLLALVLAALARAVAHCVRVRRRGESVCGGCDGCAGGCQGCMGCDRVRARRGFR